MASPAALLDVLAERAQGDGELAQWQVAAAHAGRDYFCDGFTANTAALINDVVAATVIPDDLILRSDPGLEPGERLEGCFETRTSCAPQHEGADGLQH